MDLTGFILWLQRARSPKTVDAYEYSVIKFLEWCDGEDPCEMLVDQYLTYLMEKGNSNSSVSRHFYAIKSFFKFNRRSHELEYVEVPRPERKDPVFLPHDDVVLVLEATNSTMYRSAFALQYSAALRFEELRSLNIVDVDFDDDMVRVSSVKRGAGDTTTDMIPIDPVVSELVAEYLLERTDNFPQLFAIRGGKRLSLQPYNITLLNCCNKAGVKTITSHGLRHSRATDIAQTGDLLDIQQMLRHKNPQSSLRYVHLTGRKLKERVPRAFK